MRAYLDGMFAPFLCHLGVVGKLKGLGRKRGKRVKRGCCRDALRCGLKGQRLMRKIADTLERYEVPFFGPLASRFVDDE